MKILHAIFPCLFILLLVGCSSELSDSSDIRQDLEAQKRELEAEKQALEASKQELEQQNAALIAEKEQQNAAERAKREEEARTFPSDAVAGIWNVKMVCTESDCPNRNPTDVLSETWNISYLNGQYQITVTNNAPNTNKTYTGTFDGKHLRAGFNQTGGFDAVISKVRLLVTMKNENTFEGKREVLNNNPCKITYILSAKRLG